MTPPAFINRLPPALAAVLRYAFVHDNAAIFLAGFVFDMITITRIDSWTDILIQFVYLAGLTLLLVYQYREHRGVWVPSPRVARLWKFNVEVLHFFYGGLLSSYVVLYFKSATGARSLVFFLVLVMLLFLNEMPQVRRVGHRLRLGLYAFCVVSFLNFFIPIIIGRMGGWVFALTLLVAGWLVWKVAGLLGKSDENPRATQKRLFIPAGALLTLIGGLYLFKLIPPVPLSVQFQGIYHDVRRQGDRYELVYERAPFYAPWRRDSRPYRRRDGDRLVYFARIYAPTRFRHQITIRWQFYDERRKTWQTSDRVPMSISGGRSEGFRGVAAKSNFEPGRWRVVVETEDGRAIGMLTFRVEHDARVKVRRWAGVRA
jgi:hypothetical protein